MNYIEFKAGEKEYKLVLNTKAMVQLEDKLGCNPIDILMQTQNDKLPKFKEMVAILWASLLKYQHGIKFDDCYDILDAYVEDGNSLVEFLNVVVEIFKASGIINEEDPNAKKGKK